MEKMWSSMEILDLLVRMDAGYKPTDDEKSVFESRKDLNLIDTKITELPDSIGQLSALKVLDLGVTEITELPDSIGQLSALEALYLSGTEITELPDWIGQLSALEALDLGRTKITELPDSIGQLSALKWLYLSGTKITELPDSIGQLSALEELDLGITEITELPDSIGQLSALEALDLSGTEITELPDSIGQLSALKVLDLGVTKITELPDSIGQLSALERLYLGRTKITELPDSIGQLSALEVLDLGGTEITELPDSIGSLSNLQKLDLSGLKLKRIPESLTRLGLKFVDSNSFYFSDSGINLHDTVLSEQNISIFLESPHLIPRLYNRSELETVRECKVIFLGNGSQGKSYTIRRIKNKGIKATDAEQYKTEETHGIEISDYSPENRDYRINFWDFGGQDMQHSMHRCFLTEDACYVVMVKSRETNGTEQAAYWLRNASDFAPNAPVLLYINYWEKDRNASYIDESKLKRDFKNLTEIIYCSALDAETKRFNEKVTQSIIKMVDESGYCKKEVNRHWMDAARTIRTENEKFITKARYKQICADNGIADSEAPDLLTFFNNLGVCLSYHLDAKKRELAQYMLLDPKWLTNAVYAVILEGKTSAYQGWIKRSRIKEILCDENRDKTLMLRVDKTLKYEEAELPYIIDVAAKHDLCFVEGNSSERLFFPALCESNSPDEALGNNEGYPNHAEYRFKYTYLPDSVVHKLMVRCYKKDKNVISCWLKGMVWGKQGEKKAIVRMDGAETLHISLYSTALHPACELFMTIRNELLEINKEMNFTPTEHIIEGSDEFLVARLIKARKKGKMTVDGGNSDEEYNIFELLRKFYSNSALACLDEKDGRLIPNPSGFHEYAPGDQLLRDALWEAYKPNGKKYCKCQYCGKSLVTVDDMEVDHILPTKNYEQRKNADADTLAYLAELEEKGFDLDKPDYIENYFPSCKHSNCVKNNQIRDAVTLREYHAIALRHTPAVLRLIEKYENKAKGGDSAGH